MKAPTPASLQILIVEDNPTNRLHLENLFRHLGHSSMAAANGQEALDLLPAHSFQLVAMDLHMPVMDGWTATRRIRAMNIPQPKITAVTADTFPETERKCKEAGMDYFLIKPVNIAKMKKCLCNLFPALFDTAVEPPQQVPAPPVTVPYLDLIQLQTLFGQNGAGLDANEIQGWWEMTRRDFERSLAEIHQICLARDQAAFCRIVHGLKGCALTFGAQAIAGFLSHALTEARQQRFTDWERFPSSLAVLVSSTHQAVQDHLRQLSLKS